MAVKRLPGDALPHIQTTTHNYAAMAAAPAAEDATTQAFLENQSGSITIGPIKIDYSWSLNPPEFDFTAYLLGVQIGSGTINAQNPSITVGGSVDGFKAEAKVTLGMNPLQIVIVLTICAPFVGCYSKTITIPL